ncbi:MULTISPECIES: monovalent cation/H(+) antiporter subunit G [Sphingobacterium]|uniref:Monovalent cation/H(+) antiporter subunit G n=2 Tax=Sphingobacterium TaxID=28453 RepID=A0A4Q6XED7_9SPHI|nr:MULTISPECIES: monovalent cation/H(+) antiporter subunit G [Sphingobacterium]MBD1434076.1 monovalent cation/H(+) antiporter subunit G [Sphingobacterium micropteri]RZF58171.1 monovalent cation/H(+) antiporter subunit G [Sphingobacterium corticibacterium]
MIDIVLALLSTVGALSILFASIGILRMPDFYLRLSVTVKASTLGVGLLLICAAIMFPDVSVTTKAIAIIFFLIITAPIGAHMIGRAAYFTGTPLWKGTIVDELAGMYNEETHELDSEDDDDEDDDTPNIAKTEEETE